MAPTRWLAFSAARCVARRGRTPALAAWVLLNQYSAAGMTVGGGGIIFAPSHRSLPGAGGPSVVGMDRARRELRGSVIALAMVAVTTGRGHRPTQLPQVR